MTGHFRQIGPDKFRSVLYHGRRPDGSKIYKTHTFKGTKKDAEAWHRSLLHALDTGQAAPSRLTVEAFLRQWLAEWVPGNVGRRTQEWYADVCEKRLIPAFGRTRLEALTPREIQRWETGLLTSGRRDGKGGLAPQTVLHFHRVLHTALDRAVKWDLLPRNPVELVDAPSVPTREEPRLDLAELAALLREVEGTRLEVPVLLAVTTGLRRSEVLALRWQDVDLKAGRLVVNQAVEDLKAGRRLKAPKTKKSRRPVELPALTVEALARHRARQAEWEALHGDCWEGSGLVVCWENGRAIPPNTLTHEWIRLRDRLGLPLRLQDLRHAYGSIRLDLGEPVNVVAAGLGHSSPKQLWERYGHVLRGRGKEDAARLDEHLRAALKRGEKEPVEGSD